ncbi:hypothetical protein QBC34DRAFT_115369 [Podospora aff. communis PSN243]|uniref:Uncharacterized protein n=1 Tax=Podospora aff. communis PSN243 TaxID=3040156 RepID=A0AAV9GHG7_9PEZI|nr:hypothetical protein QBC34DRAFT_115369 [Podospora aff. communis PSN243]
MSEPITVDHALAKHSGAGTRSRGSKLRELPAKHTVSESLKGCRGCVAGLRSSLTRASGTAMAFRGRDRRKSPAKATTPTHLDFFMPATRVADKVACMGHIAAQRCLVAQSRNWNWIPREQRGHRGLPVPPVIHRSSAQLHAEGCRRASKAARSGPSRSSRPSLIWCGDGERRYWFVRKTAIPVALSPGAPARTTHSSFLYSPFLWYKRSPKEWQDEVSGAGERQECTHQRSQ